MIRLSFTVPGPPVPKARARTVGVAKSTWEAMCSRCKGLVSRAHSFTPDKTKDYENHVGMMALAARLKFERTGQKWPLDAVYGLTVRVYRSRDMGDLSNFEKSIEDGCEGILWGNDKRIHRRGEGGIWAVPKGQERIEVEAWIVE